MIIGTWNVNSVRTRLKRLVDFCHKTSPDVLCLQEIKCTKEQFPIEELGAIGYHVSLFGQKQYNGVAICTKKPPDSLEISFPDNPLATEARLIRIKYAGIWFASVYAPNGKEIGSEKYQNKILWYEKLCHWLKNNPDLAKDLILLGDFNVAPSDLDVFDPKAREEGLLVSSLEREKFSQLLSCGYKDAFRDLYPEKKEFSWWDYRELSFPLNKGFRIDHILVPSPLMKFCKRMWIERDERKGEKPSDHVPVLLEIKRE